MRGAGAWLSLCAALALSGCDDGLSGRLGGAEGFAPFGTPSNEQAPDGLEIGHRMMANGEYELALKSYTRSAGEQGLGVDVLSAIGSANLKLGRLRQAKKFLEEAVERDEEFVPAWNNLGVVLTSLQEYENAHQAFRAAFALDNGQSEEVWQNLLLAINNLENNKTPVTDEAEFRLVRRGNGRFLLLETPSDRG